MVKLDDYWEKWDVNFERKMDKLPPMYDISNPLENQPSTPSLYAGQPGSTVLTTSNNSDDDLPPQPLTPSLPPQPLTSSVPAQSVITPTVFTNNGGRTILGQTSIESKDTNSLHRNTFNFYGNVYENDNGYIIQKCIQGKEVHDCFNIPSSRGKLSSIAMSGFVLVGHPDTDYFSVFSHEPATLYLFENGMCTKKTYTTTGSVTTSEVQFLSDNGCVAAKEKFQKYLKENEITIGANGANSVNMGNPSHETVAASSPVPVQPSAPSPSYDLEEDSENSKIIKVKTNFPPTNKGCVVEILVAGNGIEDKFTEPCSGKSADSIIRENIFVFGDPVKTPLCLYSNEADTLYVIKNKICTKKTYKKSNGVTISKRNPMKLAKCNEIKKSISNLLKKEQSNQPTTPSLQNTGGLKPVTSTPVRPPPVASPISIPTPLTLSPTEVLKQFTPTYPFELGNDGIHSKYDMQTRQNTDSYDVRGCYIYIKCKGNEVNDHFQVNCANENNKALSTKDFMLFGSPTSTLGLYSDTRATLIIMNKGTCYKKTYGRKPTGPTLMGGPECEQIKKKMLKSMSLNDKVINGGLKVSGSGPFGFNGYNPQPTNANNDSSDEETDGVANAGFIPPISTTQLNQQMFNPFAGTTFPGMFGPFNPFQGMDSGNSPAWSSPESEVNINPAQQSSPTSSSTGVSWRKGNYQRVYSPMPTVTITKNNNGPQDCKMVITIIGRALNDEIVGDCSVLGTNIQKKATSYSLAVADPSSNSGLYTEDWGSLVVITGGQCTTRTYDSSPITHTTKVTTSPNSLSQAQCDKVKEKISGLLGANFGY